MSQITILGVGLLGDHHLTLESVDAITRAEVVYHLVSGADAVQTLHRLNPDTYSLVGFYRDGALDLDVYATIVGFLLAQAEAGRRVAFVVMGHPSIYVAATHMLEQQGPPRGVEVRVLAALSTIDAILALMPFDIGNTGLQVLDANRMVSYGLRPMRNVPLLVFQAGCFGSGYITRTIENAPGRLRVLVDTLLQHYPPEHPLELIECAMGLPHRAVRLPLTVARLAESGHLVNYNTTIFIPAAEPCFVQDPQFHTGLVDPAAVAALVRTS